MASKSYRGIVIDQLRVNSELLSYADLSSSAIYSQAMSRVFNAQVWCFYDQSHPLHRISGMIASLCHALIRLCYFGIGYTYEGVVKYIVDRSRFSVNAILA